jgi:hypothetical protein
VKPETIRPETEARKLGDVLLEVMLAIAAKQDEPTRSDMIAILEKDGWL